jgi:hypothetical protein
MVSISATIEILPEPASTGCATEPGLQRDLKQVASHLGGTRGRKTNWVQSNPGEGWFVYFRFHGPTEPFFDKSWALPDFEKTSRGTAHGCGATGPAS